MRNIRDKLSLVFFECVQFIRHIIHGVGKISQFIVPVDLCERFKISFGITLGDDCQPMQWTVKSMCKQQKGGTVLSEKQIQWYKKQCS